MNTRFDLRRERAWERVREAAPDAEGFLVTSLVNIRYLTGFTGSNAVLMMGPAHATLGTDARYVIQASQECPDLEQLIDRDTLSAVAHSWAGSAGGPLAVESEHLSLAQYRSLATEVPQLRETLQIVEHCRVVKDAAEIDLIAQACRISDEALADVIATVREGDTERAIARRLEAAMFARGADAISFDTIVASGPNSAIPHHSPTDRPLAKGEFLLIDFGAAVGGYHADETRTFVLGAPDEWQKEVHALVRSAQECARVAATAGADLAAVDRAARGVIESAGRGEEFGHGLGHGVGLQIHEAPFMSARATGMLLAGSPVTIEPGVYLPERGGVRIEDTVAVTEGPCIPLTTTDRELLVLG